MTRKVFICPSIEHPVIYTSLFLIGLWLKTPPQKYKKWPPLSIMLNSANYISSYPVPNS